MPNDPMRVNEPLSVVGVGSNLTNRSFAYTTNFQKLKGFPELVVSNYDRNSVFDFLGNVASTLMSIGSVQLEKPVCGFLMDEDLPLFFSKFSADGLEILGQCVRNYGGVSFEAVQVILPDAHGNFPWDDNYDFVFQDFFSVGAAKAHPEVLNKMAYLFLEEEGIEPLLGAISESSIEIFIHPSVKVGATIEMFVTQLDDNTILVASNQSQLESDISSSWRVEWREVLRLDPYMHHVLDLPRGRIQTRSFDNPVWRLIDTH